MSEIKPYIVRGESVMPSHVNNTSGNPILCSCKTDDRGMLRPEGWKEHSTRKSEEIDLPEPLNDLN